MRFREDEKNHVRYSREEGINAGCARCAGAAERSLQAWQPQSMWMRETQKTTHSVQQKSTTDTRGHTWKVCSATSGWGQIPTEVHVMPSEVPRNKGLQKLPVQPQKTHRSKCIK